jgi:hypothetical protein
MSTPVEWDWPPEDRGSSRSPPDEPIADVRIQVTRQRGAGRLPQRGLYDRFINAYAKVLFTILKVLVGATLGGGVVAAVWVIVVIVRGVAS